MTLIATPPQQPLLLFLLWQQTIVEAVVVSGQLIA